MTRFISYIFLAFLVLGGCRKERTDINNYPGGIAYNHGRFPGNSATDYLSSQTYKSLRIELNYMPGFLPDTRSIDMFKELITEHLNKPNGIEIIIKEIDPTLKTVFTPDDINAVETENRSIFTTGDRMSAYILITNGTYYNSNVIGLAYKNTSVCFFGEPLQLFSIGSTPEEKSRAVALLFTHEFGHLFGLVDMGSPMTAPHMDPANSNHCNNHECIMHHSFEPVERNITRILSGVYTFDTNCINDMKSNGGK